jgi:membrane protein YdbS with pleckstrin-like domain
MPDGAKFCPECAYPADGTATVQPPATQPAPPQRSVAWGVFNGLALFFVVIPICVGGVLWAVGSSNWPVLAIFVLILLALATHAFGKVVSK